MVAKTIKMARGLELDSTAAVQKFGFIGRSGSGKTYAASRLAEGLLSIGCQTVIIDPVGVWYGLRLAADGKKEGFPISILGGLHGDVELSDKAGNAVADMIVEYEASVVIDISMMTKSGQRRFLTDFPERLFHIKKLHRSPLHIILEEAQTFLPQRTMKGDERMLGAWETLCKVGRNFGIGYTLVTQRPQAVHKEILNQTECLFLMQSNGHHERKAICEWATDAGDATSASAKELYRELPTLEQGEAVVWSPQWLKIRKRVKILKKKTYNASETPMLGKDFNPVKPKPLGEVAMCVLTDLDKKQEKSPTRELGDAKKEIIKRETTIANLHKQIKEMTSYHESRLKELSIATKDGLSAKAKDLLHRLRLGAVANEELTRELVAEIHTAHSPFNIGRIDPGGQKPKPKPKQEATKPRVKYETTPDSNRESQAGCDPQLQRKPIVMLQALMQVGGPLSRDQLAKFAGIRTRGSTFSSYLSILNTSGLIRKLVDNHVGITVEGEAWLVDHGRLPKANQTEEDVQQMWREKISAGKARLIYDILIEAFPHSKERSELAEAADISLNGSTFSSYLSMLNTLGLIEKNGEDIRAHRELFDHAKEEANA